MSVFLFFSFIRLSIIGLGVDAFDVWEVLLVEDLLITIYELFVCVSASEKDHVGSHSLSLFSFYLYLLYQSTLFIERTSAFFFLTSAMLVGWWSSSSNRLWRRASSFDGPLDRTLRKRALVPIYNSIKGLVSLFVPCDMPPTNDLIYTLVQQYIHFKQ